jgi:hypothetical protein
VSYMIPVILWRLWHRMENHGKAPVVLTEVQYGA